jgi:hypothetical protein
MSIGDKAGLETVKELTDKTLPAVDAVIDADVANIDNKLHGVLDRLNGTTIDISAFGKTLLTLTLRIPGRK